MRHVPRSPRGALRVLAADDSAVMRGALRAVFQRHGESPRSGLPRMELCGLVKDGVECLEAVQRLRPDAVLLDLEMPRLNGLEALARLRVEAPEVPVILCSAYAEHGGVRTRVALALGAKDYVLKPSAQGGCAPALEALMKQVLPRLAMLERGRRVGPKAVEVVVIGVSTGGPSALESMLPGLPESFAAPVLVVQHMPKQFTAALAQRLDRVCPLRVREAFGGAEVKPGTIWLAPGDAHMEIAGGGGGGWTLTLHSRQRLNSCMPSADYLFQSAAEVVGAGTMAVVMTGMGSDGLEGARAVRGAGGRVLVQDQASSAVWGMPGRVMQAGLAEAVLPLDRLAAALVERVSGRNQYEALTEQQQESFYGS